MLESFQLSLNKTLLQMTLRYRGILLACRSLRAFVQPSAPRAEQALGFGRAERTLCCMSLGLASASGDMDETPETVRHPPGDAGEPQGSQRAPEFTRQRQSSAGFESQHEDDDDFFFFFFL